jgi:dUTPase
MQSLSFFTKTTAKLPTKNNNDLNIHLYANIIKNNEKSKEIILPKDYIEIDLGIATKIASSYIGLLYNTRSQKLQSINFIENFNIITSEDTDFLSVKLINYGIKPYTVFHNQYIANLIIIPSVIPIVQQINYL